MVVLIPLDVEAERVLFLVAIAAEILPQPQQQRAAAVVSLCYDSLVPSPAMPADGVAVQAVVHASDRVAYANMLPSSRVPDLSPLFRPPPPSSCPLVFGCRGVCVV